MTVAREKDRYHINLTVPKPITSEAQHAHYIRLLVEIDRQDSVSFDKKIYAGILAWMIEKYESEKYKIRRAAPVEVLRDLMEANDLKQKDLAPLFGSESIVSEVLNGRRSLNKEHIARLSAKFRVSPAVFF